MYKTKFAIFFIVGVFFVSLNSGCSHKPLISNLRSDIYIARCVVLNSEFEVVRRLSSGWVCIPRSDGGWLSSDSESLTSFSSDGTVEWQKRGHYHHQMRIYNDKILFVLSSEVKDIKGAPTKFDIVQKLDLKTGQLLASFSMYEALFESKILQEPHFVSFVRDASFKSSRFFSNAKLERTHLNSIHVSSDKVVVNDLSGGAFVLDHSLSFIRTVSEGSSRGPHKYRFVHDLQILSDGSILFFNNLYTRSSGGVRSSFKVHHNLGTQVLFGFPSEEKDFQSVSCCGGVEKLGELYLVGFPVDVKVGEKSLVGLVSSQGHWVVKKELPFRIQDVKRIPYPDYLNLNKIR